MLLLGLGTRSIVRPWTLTLAVVALIITQTVHPNNYQISFLH